MSEANQQVTDEQPRMTPEELKQRREDLRKYHTEMMPFLQAQLQYETTLTEIEAQRFKRFQMDLSMANALAPPPPEPGDGPEGRKLKKTLTPGKLEEGGGKP